MSTTEPAPEPTREAPFFIGWASLPAALAVPLTFVAAALIAGFAALALGLGASTGDPGPGGFDWAAGRLEMAGVVQARPYPILRLPPSAAHPDGHAVMLAGVGKVGAQAPAAPLDGKAAMAAGFLIKRGDLDMLQLDGPDGLVATAAATGTPAAAAGTPPPPATPLGRYPPRRRALRRQVLRRRHAARHRPRPQGLRQPLPRRRPAARLRLDRAD